MFRAFAVVPRCRVSAVFASDILSVSSLMLLVRASFLPVPPRPTLSPSLSVCLPCRQMTGLRYIVDVEGRAFWESAFSPFRVAVSFPELLSCLETRCAITQSHRENLKETLNDAGQNLVTVHR